MEVKAQAKQLLKSFRTDYPTLSEDDAVEFVIGEIKSSEPYTDLELEEIQQLVEELAANYYFNKNIS